MARNFQPAGFFGRHRRRRLFAAGMRGRGWRAACRGARRAARWQAQIRMGRQAGPGKCFCRRGLRTYPASGFPARGPGPGAEALRICPGCKCSRKKRPGSGQAARDRGRETGRRAKLGVLRFRSLRFRARPGLWGLRPRRRQGEMRAPGRVSTVCQIRMLKHCKKIFCYGFLVVKVF